MIRFLVGAVLGAFGMLYLVAHLLPASSETTTSDTRAWGYTDDGSFWATSTAT